MNRGNWIDRMVAYVSPNAAVARARSRAILAAVRGYESSEPSRKRRFHRNIMSGEELANAGAVALRNQARHLERNHDIARGIVDKLVDFTIGASGINVEPNPRRRDGSIHEDFADELDRAHARWSQRPEVTATHDRASMERLAARTWFRDGEVLGQLVSGIRPDLKHGSDTPFSIELIEPDMLPMDLNNNAINLRHGIERDAWGRARAYHLLTVHPGDLIALDPLKTKRVPADRIMHVRQVDRIGQLRGITLFASIAATLQDIFEYEDSERIAAKMAASLVLKITRGSPQDFNPNGTYDPNAPPIYQMDGGMVVVNQGVGEDSELFDTKRPNTNAEPFVNGQLRRVAAGAGLSYSAVSRNYNGTYSAQRQELVENWPHYHAQTGHFVAQWARPAYQEFVRWYAMTHKVPSDIDPASISDAMFFGPAMPWIDPDKEAKAQIRLVQASFKSTASVIRERGGSLRETWQQISKENKTRETLGLAPLADANGELPEPASQSQETA